MKKRKEKKKNCPMEGAIASSSSPSPLKYLSMMPYAFL